MSVTVTMTSDFICSWCLIGEQRLFEAIDSLPPGLEVQVDWLPFELNPQMPKEGMDRKLYRSQKFGSLARSQELDAYTVAAGKREGIAFDYDRMTRTPNTFAAHRLTWLAAREGRQRAVVEGILRSYFTEGRDIGDLDTLTEIAGEAGLDRERVRAFLASNEGEVEVRALIDGALARGVAGVPHFDIDGSVVTGAQRPETLRHAILAAQARKAQAAE